MDVETPQDVQRSFGRLSDSAWAFSALLAAFEIGLLEALRSSPTVEEAAAQSGVTYDLAMTLLDVLAALDLARHEGDRYVPATGLRLFLESTSRDDLLAGLRSTHFQAGHLADAARRGTLRPGWEFDDPEILQAQGRTGRMITHFMATSVFPMLSGLEERLRSPGATFLDVGIGVGIISIELCRIYPELHVVGLEPREASAAEARKNIAEAGLQDRIELRSERIEDLADRESFDLVYLPQVFLPREITERGLRTIWRALRPGGWAMLVALAVPGEDLSATIKRLMNVLWGGPPLPGEQLAGMMAEAGYESVEVGRDPGNSMATGVAGRRPL